MELQWENLGRAGGGLIRDSAGFWVKGFSRSLGTGTSMLAECWALRDGLFLAIQLGIQNLEVELDAKVVVDLINSTPKLMQRILLFWWIAGCC